MDEEMLTPDEVRRLLKISRTQSYSLKLQAALHAVHIFGSLRYPAKYVLTAMEQGIQEVYESNAR